MLTEKERDAILKILEFEEGLPGDAFDEEQKYHLGWSWKDVKVHASILNNLLIKGYLVTLFDSNSYTGYRLTDEGRVLYESEIEEEERFEAAKGELSVPEDLFSIIEGYEDIKEIFLSSLHGEPVDFLMVGTPGSAKTMFLSELERIGGATPIILSGTASKVGIVDVLFDYSPTILLLDEFEHLNTKDYTILLSLCETRVISETKHGKTRRMELPNTRVFAGANSTRLIPIAVLDRMQRITFRSYTKKEFGIVTVNVLVKRMNIPEEVAEYIADKTWEFSHSIRQVIRIAKMAKTVKEVDRLLEVMQKYSG